MPSERYVVVGLARVQARWFDEVASWSTSGALPVEFLKVLSVEELRARLQSGRAFSALLVDATLPGCDRDLAEQATAAGSALVVVDERFGDRHWHQLGAAAVLRPDFRPDDLLGVLRSAAKPVTRTDVVPEPRRAEAGRAGAWRGRLVAVTGAGGTGRSTVAMALAAGLAADPRDRQLVVLADLALRAQQGLLHDAGDLVPGLSELVDAHRSAVLAPDEVRKLCFQVVDQGYDLLIGLRRPRDWAALRPATFSAALDGLRRSYRVVVADVDADVEGEHECGSVEVEERNLLARVSLRAADLVVVVGTSGVAGVHTHVNVVRDLLEIGVPADRLVPVTNRAPRNPRARAGLAAAMAELLQSMATQGEAGLATTPLFVTERRRLDEALRDDARLPATFVAAISVPVRAVLDRLSSAGTETDTGSAQPEPTTPVTPGSLARWSALSGEHV
ncbi:MAG: hypothetical protein ACRD2C_28410 [Acidimicrobiales bacterium]